MVVLIAAQGFQGGYEHLVVLGRCQVSFAVVDRAAAGQVFDLNQWPHLTRPLVHDLGQIVVHRCHRTFREDADLGSRGPSRRFGTSGQNRRRHQVRVLVERGHIRAGHDDPVWAVQG